MEKNELLNELEQISKSKNTIKFIGKILDLQDEDIQKFSYDEVQQIAEFASPLGYDNFPDIINMLDNSGHYYYEKGYFGDNSERNYVLARFYRLLYINIQKQRGALQPGNLLNLALILGCLGEDGVDSLFNLNQALHLCSEEREKLKISQKLTVAINICEGCTRRNLARIGVEREKNNRLALKLAKDTKKIVKKDTSSYAHACLHEAQALTALADMGIETRKNLKKIITICRKAKQIPNIDNYLFKLLFFPEGMAHLLLANLDINPIDNISDAIELMKQSQELFESNDTNLAGALLNEGYAKIFLADRDIEAEKNLLDAINIFQKAISIVNPSHPLYASILMAKGIAYKDLAKTGLNSEENFQNSITSFKDTRNHSSSDSVSFTRAIINEGIVHILLAKRGSAGTTEFSKGLDLLEYSIKQYYSFGDGYGYSTGLNIAIQAYIEAYYVSGNSMFFERGRNFLVKASLKIKDCDVEFQKNTEAKLHVFQAVLHQYHQTPEFDLAAREYNEAYKLSGEDYYKFMDDFCRAQDSKLSFCNFIETWKDIKKTELMPEFFAFAVFECHIERSLNSSVNEENEIKSALLALEDIRDKTKNNLLKTRFEGYIALIRAVLYCIEKKQFTEAKSEVKKGCEVFREYDDRAGIKMCEIFHDAILVPENRDGWRNAMIRCQPLTGNIATLLYRYTDRREKELDLHNFYLNDRIDHFESSMHSRFDQTDSKINSLQDEMKRLNNELKNQLQEINSLSKMGSDQERNDLKIISSEFSRLIKENKNDQLLLFSDKICKEKAVLIDIINSSSLTPDEKIQLVKRIEHLANIEPTNVEKINEFGKDILKEIPASVTAEIILKELVPLLKTAYISALPLIGKFAQIIISNP